MTLDVINPATTARNPGGPTIRTGAVRPEFACVSRSPGRPVT